MTGSKTVWKKESGQSRWIFRRISGTTHCEKHAAGAGVCLRWVRVAKQAREEYVDALSHPRALSGHSMWTQV